MCPRCGTPFTHVVTEEEQSAIVPPPVPDVTSEVDASQQPSEPKPSEQSIDTPEHQDDKSEPVFSKRSEYVSPPFVESPLNHNIPPGQRRGHRRTCLGAFLIFMLFFCFLLIKCGCGSDEESAGSRLEGTAITEEQDNSDSLHAPGREEAVPAPDWIFGTWRLNTDYGPIVVRIAGEWIRETSGGGTSHGVFYYTPGQVNADFHDGKIMIYKVDEHRHSIDAGEGMWMRKISEN